MNMKLYKTVLGIALAGLLFPNMVAAAPDLQTTAIIENSC